MNIQETLINFMREQAYKPMDARELGRIFDIKKSEFQEFQNTLNYMEKDGLIVKTRTEHYGLPERMGLVVGKIQGHQKGFGFLIPDEERPDIFIPSSNLNGAMHNDRVIVKILREENP